MRGRLVRGLAFFVGLVFCLGVYQDAFQTIILPRRPSGRFRITRLFYLMTWTPWSALACRVTDKRIKEQVYSVFGPASLLLLLVVWALLHVVGFGCLYYALGTPFSDSMGMSRATAPFRTDLYVSGTTLFTLGLGDVLPTTLAARVVVIFEAGTGLGFVAAVIGYVPVLYQAFSRREVDIALLDTRAGSPPTAGEMLRRHHFAGGDEALILLLTQWERWSAEILESHISYPLLCYYRSQHDNQSWLAALTAVLDACALLIAVVEGPASRQAQLTFAMARHALIDLGHVFNVEKKSKTWLEHGNSDRLPAETFRRLCAALGEVGIRLCGDEAAALRLRAMRTLYEPHACALSDYIGMSLPGWVAEENAKDQWVTIGRLRAQAEAALAANANGDGGKAQRALVEEEMH